MILGQYGAVGWYLVILGQYRAICDGTGSVEGGAGQYFYHWVSRRWYWAQSLKSVLVLPAQILGPFGPPKKRVNIDMFKKDQKRVS